jgi:hypothetical protein
MNVPDKASPMQARSKKTFLSSVVAMACAAMLAGCSANFVPSPVQPDHVLVGPIRGNVHGGQQAISGAHIYLYAAGTTGYASAATSLICNSTTDPNFQTTTCPDAGNVDGNGNYYVITDGSGNFNISGDYMCTSGTQVYLVAYAGNPGLTAGTNNTIIMQMAGLGECPSSGTLAQQVPYVTINEISTVVFAYAMGGFGTSATHIGAPASNSTGIANAMANVSNVMSIWYGQAYTQAQVNTNSTVPQATIYALANALGACVNSTGSTAANQPCGKLLTYATPPGGTAPADESQAIFNVAHNPGLPIYNAGGTLTGNNVSNLYTLGTPTPAFTANTPLTGAPQDWTLAVVYKGLVSTPFNIAFDANGTGWIGDKSLDAVIEVGPQGATQKFTKNQANGNTAFETIKGVAVDPTGNIWITDYDRSQLYVMNSAGTVTSYVHTDLNGPAAVAIGYLPSSTTTWYAYVANEGNGTVSVFTSGGTALVNQTALQVDQPAWISVDSQGDALVPSTSSGEIGELQTNYNTKTGAVTWTAEAIGGFASYAIVLDSSNTAWFGDVDNPGHLYQFSSTTTTKNNKTTTTYSDTSSHTNGGLQTPYMAAVDGAGTVWIANDSNNTISGWNQTTGKWLTDTTTQGLQTGANVNSDCLAVSTDPSGNVWTANSDGTVTQLLGLAAPTATPISSANLGTKP